MNRIILVIACCIMITIPQLSVATPKAPHNSSSIHFYRVHRLIGGFAPTILIDGHKVGSVANGGHLYVRVAPGQHVLSISKFLAHDIVQRIHVKPNQKQTWQVYFGPSGGYDMYSGGLVLPSNDWQFIHR